VRSARVFKWGYRKLEFHDLPTRLAEKHTILMGGRPELRVYSCLWTLPPAFRAATEAPQRCRPRRFCSAGAIVACIDSAPPTANGCEPAALGRTRFGEHVCRCATQLTQALPRRGSTPARLSRRGYGWQSRRSAAFRRNNAPNWGAWPRLGRAPAAGNRPRRATAAEGAAGSCSTRVPAFCSLSRLLQRVRQHNSAEPRHPASPPTRLGGRNRHH
jgi:hypothetical protein